MLLRDEMTPLERARAIEAGAAFDRYPCVPFMGDIKRRLVSAGDYDFWNDHKTMVRAERSAFLRWGYDRIAVGPNTRSIVAAIMGVTPYLSERGSCGDLDLQTCCAAFRNLDPYSIARAKEIDTSLRAIDQLVEEYGDVVPVVASVGGPFTIASQLIGTERLLRLCRKDLRMVFLLLDFVSRVQIECIDRIARYGVGIAMADPVANPVSIGPALYEKMAFPVMLDVCSYAKNTNGEGVFLHMCGKTECIWGCLQQYPLAEFSMDEAVDLECAVDGLGDSFTLAGNIDPVGAILFGSRADISSEVRRCIRSGSRAKKGFVLAPGCDIPFNTNLEKIDMLMEECRLFGLGEGLANTICIEE